MSDRSNRLYDEFARLFTDAAGVAQGVRREAETMFRGQVEKLIAGMDLVRREDFEVVQEMAAKARAENEVLAARIAALEAKLGGAPVGATAKTSRPKRAPRAAASGEPSSDVNGVDDEDPPAGSTGT